MSTSSRLLAIIGFPCVPCKVPFPHAMRPLLSLFSLSAMGFDDAFISITKWRLCEVSADLSASDYSRITPLHLAAKRASDVLVRELLSLGADPDVADLDDRMTLYYSCSSEQSIIAVIRTLLEKGADVMTRDSQGISPIRLAAEHGLAAIVRELALCGAELDCEDSDGQRPLDYAMKKGGNDVVIEVLRPHPPFRLQCRPLFPLI